jgi:tRNA(fMet)-specific endonuclease VapC
MKFLLDTDTCVFWLRGYASIRERLAVAGPGAIAISVITLAELRYGANCSSRSKSNHQAVNDFISAISVLGLGLPTARAFGDIKAQLRKEGMLMADFDLLIAATARTHDLTVVTNNLRHFGRIPDLHLENWVQCDPSS